MRRIVIESPYSISNGKTIDENIAYARLCMRDSIMRGEAPIASHLLYTQPGILNDLIPSERKLGMECGFAWNLIAHAVIVYEDIGISSGMQKGLEFARQHGITVEVRKLLSR